MTSTRTVAFTDLDPASAYAVWRLRQDVFVVEQDCAYPDLDGRDDEPGTRHVLLRDDDTVLGYARVLDDGETWRIGRVVLAKVARGRGLADHVMTTALQVAKGRDVVLEPATLFDMCGKDDVSKPSLEVVYDAA